MDRIRTIIIDDEPQAISALKQEIELHCNNDIDLIATANEVDEAVELINLLKPQLLFLDIQLSGKTGFEVLSATEGMAYNVIFTTAYSEYAIQAIKFSAFDYLLKPIDRFELVAAITKLKTQEKEKHNITQSQIDLYEKFSKASAAEKRIALNTKEGLKITMLSEIVYLEANGNYTKVFFDKERMCLISKTLKDFERLLGSNGFCRIHHSILVNMSFVEIFNSKESFIRLKDGKVLMVSFRRRAVISSFLKEGLI